MIREYLKEHILITDGAMGTYYDRKKSENGRIAEEANLLEPELITRIHEEYLEQGARLIRTNTFAANHVSLEPQLSGRFILHFGSVGVETGAESSRKPSGGNFCRSRYWTGGGKSV